MGNIKRTDRFCLTCGKKLGWSAKYQPQRNINYCRFCFSKSDNFKGKIIKTTFKKGSIPWNKNKKRPEFSGKNNPNWKGGVTPIYKALRKTSEYEEWRRKVFNRDNYTCKICGQIGGRLQTDHIKSWSLYPKLRFELFNGQTLCYECHKLKTKIESKENWSNQFSLGIYKVSQKIGS